jgi:LEA14-like dessication related protein
MKRICAVIILAVCAAAVGALDAPKPTAEIKRFQVEAISLRDVTFLFELSVKNPYPVKLSFSGMKLDFSVEGSKVFSVTDKGGFSVSAKGEKSSTFTVTLAYDAIIKLVKDYAAKEWLDTVIDGVLVIPLPTMPGLPKDISFKYKLSKKIPAIKPRLAITAFTVTPPSAEQVGKAVVKAGSKVPPGKALGVYKDVLAGRKPAEPVIDPAELDVPISVSFTLEIQNEAKGALSFDALDYELFVNGESLVLGKSSKVVREAGRTLVTVTNEFSSRRLSKNLKALFTDKKGSFSVKGKAALKLPDEIRKEPVPLSFDESGAFSFK